MRNPTHNTERDREHMERYNREFIEAMDKDQAYSISDKRTTNLKEAMRIVEEDKTMTVYQKIAALGDCLIRVCTLIGTDDAHHIIKDVQNILDAPYRE